jgi:hypothetical protein
MSLVQDDHVIQAFTADAPDEALHIKVLPGTPRGNDHLFNGAPQVGVVCHTVRMRSRTSLAIAGQPGVPCWLSCLR